MGWLANAFTWWNGASWGTSIVTRRRGKEVGRDDAGNVYYEDKKNPARRWVIYSGSNDGSRVPPAWDAWLRGMIAELPGEALPPVRKFQIPPTVNLTGTMAAFRPDGAIGSGKIRPASTGDYEPWIPE
jgi:NADH:ubiquinone oxidoreductase subunit